MEVYFIVYKHKNTGTPYVEIFETFESHQKRLDEIVKKNKYLIICVGSDEVKR